VFIYLFFIITFEFLATKSTFQFSLFVCCFPQCHCGVGGGKIVGFHVGGIANRWEYAIAGEAMDQSTFAEVGLDFSH
jgi:hypothetical protein